jgi:hypothetical protein
MPCPRRGPTAPSNAFSVLKQGHAVTSGRRDRSSPLLSALCNHPRHCSTTLDTVVTSRRRWDARGQDVANSDHCAAYGPPSIAPSNQPTTAASQPTATPPPSKPLLYEHRTHHDASTGAGFARTRQDDRQLHNTARHTSTRRETVRHACKLLSPWPIKGGAVPQPRDTGRRIANTHTLSAFSTILALASINTSGTWGPGLFSRLACSHPSTSTTVQAIQYPEHTTAGRTAPAGTRINQVSLVA